MIDIGLVKKIIGAFIIGVCTLFVSSLYDIEHLKAADMVTEQKYDTIMTSLNRLHIKVDKLNE